MPMNDAGPLDADILEFISQDGCTDEQFDQLALRLFAYQYRANAIFRSFCQRRGATLRSVKSWRDIPAVPIDAFKLSELRCEPPISSERVFMTSGTTRADMRGRHFHPRRYARTAFSPATGGVRPVYDAQFRAASDAGRGASAYGDSVSR